METFAQHVDTSRARSRGRRPTRGVSAAVRLGQSTARAAAVTAVIGSAGPAVAAETVSPLPILLWVAAPLLVAGASAVVAYAIGLASRRLRRLLKPQQGSLHRKLTEP